MAGTHNYDEDTVQLLLDSGDDAQIEDGLRRIEKALKLGLCGAVRSRFPGVSTEELRECWQETMLALWKTAKARTFDLSKPLKSQLYKILRCRAIDCLRKKGRHDTYEQDRKNRPMPETLDPANDIELEDVMKAVEEALATLPPKQQLVFATYYAGLPHTEDLRFLRDEVARQTGPMETVASVKRARDEAKEKVKGYLERRGIRERRSNDERGETRS